MKSLLQILFLILILISCKEKNEKKQELAKSEFNLEKDLTNFKTKISDLDTIQIWFNHSVCTYEGYERIEITKFLDSINIKTEYKEETNSKNPKWKLVYEKRLPINDTIWKIEEFLEQNIGRQKSTRKEDGTLQISYKGVKIDYFTHGLVDLNNFMADYFETMRKIHPENKNSIYGVDIPEIEEIEEIEDLKETKIQ